MFLIQIVSLKHPFGPVDIAPFNELFTSFHAPSWRSFHRFPLLLNSLWITLNSILE